MGESTDSGGQASSGTRLETACCTPYPVLCTDNPHYRSHRFGPHCTPQIGEDHRGDCRRACSGAAARDQRLFLFHGMASAAYYGTCARVVSPTVADGRSDHLTTSVLIASSLVTALPDYSGKLASPRRSAPIS